MSTNLIKHVSTSLIPVGEEWNNIVKMGEILFQSGFFPESVKNATQGLAILLHGRDLGVKPTIAAKNIFLVRGRTDISAALMRALASRIPGFQQGVKESDAEHAIYWSKRPGCPVLETLYTMKEAAQADLTKGDNYRKYPKPMMVAGACRANLRINAADALFGMYGPEEFGEEALPEDTVEIPITPPPADETIIDATEFKEIKDAAILDAIHEPFNQKGE